MRTKWSVLVVAIVVLASCSSASTATPPVDLTRDGAAPVAAVAADPCPSRDGPGVEGSAIARADEPGVWDVTIDWWGLGLVQGTLRIGDADPLVGFRYDGPNDGVPWVVGEPVSVLDVVSDRGEATVTVAVDATEPIVLTAAVNGERQRMHRGPDGECQPSWNFTTVGTEVIIEP